MGTEDRFAKVGRDAFSFLLSTVVDQNEAAAVMEVSAATVSRWTRSVPERPFGRQTVRSWRATWFGYPSPLPLLDRICERTTGSDFWATTTFSRGREEGLRLALDEETVLTVCRQMKVPPTTTRRICGVFPWPSQWTALDRICERKLGKGWPEFVMSFETEISREPLQISGLRCLLRPLWPKIWK